MGIETVPHETCFYCGQEFPRPVSLHHDEGECNLIVEQREDAWAKWKGEFVTRLPKQSFEEGWGAALRLSSTARSETALEAVQRLKEGGTGAFIILAAVSKVYDMEAKYRDDEGN